MTAMEIWVYRDESWAGTDLTGYSVEATDGSIGKVDECTNATGASYLVVDTGPWILGKKVMLPAGVVDRIDPEDEKVYVDLTKDQIKNAPEFDEDAHTSDGYRSSLADYYYECQKARAYVDHV